MRKSPDSFNGYLSVDNDVFAYNISDFIVTLFPAQSDERKRRKAVERIRSHNTDSPEYLYGEQYGHQIAILRKAKFHTGFFKQDSVIRFATSLVIKSDDNTGFFYNNLTEPWDKFHAITFYGGSINSIGNPKKAVEPFDPVKYENSDGAREIKTRPWSDYTRSIEFKINEQKVTLTVSASQSFERYNDNNFGSYSLGELSSFMRFSFDTAQDFVRIEEYYKIAKSLIAILIGQNNIYFDVELCQRNADNLYFKTAQCIINDGYANYASKNVYRVINLFDVIDFVPNLIEKIVKNECDGLLSLLPQDNERADRISTTDIQNLCTALEIAYNWKKRNREKDRYIKQLKKTISDTIKEFVKDNPSIDAYKQTTISSAFQYLDYTLREKILTLYNENYEVINEIISRWSLPPMNEENVKAFVRLRNDKTHSGTFKWGDSVNLYPALFALVYASLFQYVGLPKEKIKSILPQII